MKKLSLQLYVRVFLWRNGTSLKMTSQTTLILTIVIVFLITLGQSKKGSTLGERCTLDHECNGKHVFCNRTAHLCQCHYDYSIQVATKKGTICAKATELTDYCLADEVCQILDVNSFCGQDGVKAICMCKLGFHPIYDKSQQRDRCVREGKLLNSDLLTLVIVGTAMTLFCGLTCLVLRIFAKARFGNRRGRYSNAQNTPPVLTLSTEHGDFRRPSQSRNSSQRSSLAEVSRRQSGSLLAPPTRGENSRRASNTSIRSTTSGKSQRSYSLRNPAGHVNLSAAANHQHLQHRPSDPEARSQLSLPYTNRRPSSISSQENERDNISGSGSTASVTFNLPTTGSNSQKGPSPVKKGKRSGSAGTLPV